LRNQGLLSFIAFRRWSPAWSLKAGLPPAGSGAGRRGVERASLGQPSPARRLPVHHHSSVALPVEHR